MGADPSQTTEVPLRGIRAGGSCGARARTAQVLSKCAFQVAVAAIAPVSCTPSCWETTTERVEVPGHTSTLRVLAPGNPAPLSASFVAEGDDVVGTVT